MGRIKKFGQRKFRPNQHSKLKNVLESCVNNIADISVNNISVSSSDVAPRGDEVSDLQHVNNASSSSNVNISSASARKLSCSEELFKIVIIVVAE